MRKNQNVKIRVYEYDGKKDYTSNLLHIFFLLCLLCVLAFISFFLFFLYTALFYIIAH